MRYQVKYKVGKELKRPLIFLTSIFIAIFKMGKLEKSLIFLISIFISILSITLLPYSAFSLKNLMLAFFLIIPFFIILFGKIADNIIKIFNKVASRTLLFHDYRLFLPLFLYYLVLSNFMSFLMKNSLIFSGFTLTDFEIAIIALSLAFLPRVIGFTAAHERTRIMLLSILTPLTTFSLPLLIFKWEEVILISLETVKYCLVGSLIFPSFGELWIWIAQRMPYKILVKSPEYQRPDFLDGVKAKPWEQDWMKFIKDFNDPDLEYVRPIIIHAFKAGLREAITKKSHDLTLKILNALESVDRTIKDSSKFLDLVKEENEALIWCLSGGIVTGYNLHVLEKWAKDLNWGLRLVAAVSLRNVAKSKPSEVSSILYELAEDEDGWIRKIAEESLREGETKWL